MVWCCVTALPASCGSRSLTCSALATLAHSISRHTAPIPRCPTPWDPLAGYLRSLLPHLLLASIYWSLLRATCMSPFFLQRSPQSPYSSQGHLSSPDTVPVSFLFIPCPPMDRRLHEDTTVPLEPGMASLAHYALYEYLPDE